MTKSIYQIQIALNGTKPKIWRRILIPSDLLLTDFHNIIQVTMGWENAHLHQFIKNKIFYLVRFHDDDFWDEMNNIDYIKMKIRVSDLLKKENEKIIYEYDFGDGWEHELILEKILPVDKNIEYPVCLAGEMNCPPEDCGGIWGYANILEILAHPDHDEYEDVMEWLGGEFDPEYFNVEEKNELLKM